MSNAHIPPVEISLFGLNGKGFSTMTPARLYYTFSHWAGRARAIASSYVIGRMRAACTGVQLLKVVMVMVNSHLVHDIHGFESNITDNS